MKLTAHTDFGLRVLLSLGAVSERLMTVAELADRHRVSQNHLMKVAQSLIHAGFVEGVRGRTGGLRLALPPQEIRMGDVIRALEDDLALVPCLGDGEHSCILVGACRLTSAIGRARTAFLAELDSVTLADVVAPRRALRARLDVA